MPGQTEPSVSGENSLDSFVLRFVRGSDEPPAPPRGVA